MRHIKPQSALLQTTPTQIGSEAFLGVAAGIGFRLSDSRILAHEATVWEALKVAPRSAPLPAPTIAKRHAEWLMMGHSVHRCPLAAVGHRVDWTCSIRLAQSNKWVSCAAEAQALPESEAEARLATDHTQAARGRSSENPVGTTAHAPPLQLAGAFGISASPMAGTGPVGTEWPDRQRWMPARPSTVEEMARDGTHMGWPQHIDTRFFQLAPPNQWCDRRAWEAASEYELRAVGPQGCGFEGRLPKLRPRVLYTHRDSSGSQEMQSELQTVWFLPDQDIGVMWWTGSIASEYFLDDSVDDLLLAFHDTGESVPASTLQDFARRRKSLDDRDPLLQADTILMPSIERDWTWEIILDSSDHPRFGLAAKGHARTRERLATSLATLAEASQRIAQAEARHRQLATDKTAAPRACAGRNWQALFAGGKPERLDGAVIQDADLSGIEFVGWQFKSARFERCTLDKTFWQNCRFEATTFVDCTLRSSRSHACSWLEASLRRCDLSQSDWQQSRLETLTFDTCRLERFRAVKGEWRQVSMTACRGVSGTLQDLSIDTLVLSEVSLPDWHWKDLSADGIGLVKSHLDRLQLEACSLLKSSVVETSLAASRWDRCTMRMGVLGARSSIEASSMSDCLFETSSWNELDARDISVRHCSFTTFTAQRLNAVGSGWHSSILHDTNAMHADFARATFEQCAMQEIMLHGANMTKTRVHRCNLIHAKTGWALTSPRPAWVDNVEVGHLPLPRRQP